MEMWLCGTRKPAKHKEAFDRNATVKHPRMPIHRTGNHLLTGSIFCTEHHHTASRPHGSQTVRSQRRALEIHSRGNHSRLTIDMYRVSATLNRGARRRAKLERVVSVKLHPRAHKFIHIRRPRHFVVAASRLGVPARVVPSKILPKQ